MIYPNLRATSFTDCRFGRFQVECTDLRPDFPPAFWRIRRLVSGLKRLLFPVSISLQIPAA